MELLNSALGERSLVFMFSDFFNLQSVRSNDHIVTVKMPFPFREMSRKVRYVPEYLHGGQRPCWQERSKR